MSAPKTSGKNSWLQQIAFWKDPNEKNRPEKYLDGQPRSEFLVSLFKSQIITHSLDRNLSILELGCNVGRNLHFLHQYGLENLQGVEINSDAIHLMRKKYPSLSFVPIWGMTIEDYFTQDPLPVDVIFTMAVLEHIHPESEWVFTEIANHCRKIITVEDERWESERHWPRNYKSVFENRGFKQIFSQPCDDVPGLGKTFMARVFTKE